MSASSWQILIGIISILCAGGVAGLGSFIGIRVGLAKLESEIASLKEGHNQHHERLKRLEDPYFRR